MAAITDGAGGGDHGPEFRALVASNPGLAAESWDGHAVVDVVDVPGVDDVGPFVWQELAGERRAVLGPLS